MPSKKTKTRSKARKVSSRTGKAKTRKRSAEKKILAKKKTVQKPRPKPKRSRKKRLLVNPQSELEREFQGQRGRSGRRRLPQRSEEFEGLSRAERADSESVDELAQEGNLFEAGAVAGVEEADDADEKEVRTRELPEDDVPEEYRDKD